MKSRTRKLCFIFSILALLAAGSPLRASAHELSNVSNPQVVIVLDITSPHCFQVETVVSPQTHAILSQTHQHCPLGTTLSTHQLSLSEAIATHHNDYIVVPRKNVTQSVANQTAKQIEQLLFNTKKHFSALSSQVIPLSDCGKQLYWDIYDSQYGVGYDAVLNYYVSTTCKTVVLNRASVTGDSSDGNHQINFYGFNYSNYGGNNWVPDCRWVSTGNTVTWPSALNNTSSGAGGTFEFFMSADTCVGANWITSIYQVN